MFWRVSTVAALTAMLAGCVGFPSQGPAPFAIATTGEAPAEGRTGYLFVDLHPGMMALHERMGPVSEGTSVLDRAPAGELRVGVGDLLNITIFEAGAGGLFIPAEAGSRAGNFVSLPTQEVDAAGRVQVPFAGMVPAAGRRLADIKQTIEDRLRQRAIEPQAVVTLQESRSTLVTVTGEVNQPVRFALARSNDTILDAVTRAGGSKWPPYETYVTLQRGGRTATVYFNRLLEKAENNIRLRPGDVLSVLRLTRSFMALGASGNNGFINFEAERLTLAQAVGRAGGILDSRGEPGHTFLYRMEDRKVVEAMGYDLQHYKKDKVPVIYRADLRDPQGFFLASRFPMRDKDILYVSNAASVEVTKVLQLLQLGANTVTDVDVSRIALKAGRR